MNPTFTRTPCDVAIAVGVLLVLTPPPPPSVDYGGYLPHYQGPGTTTPGGMGRGV